MAPKIMVTVFGQHRSVDIEAIIDTGFAGILCLPMDVAKRIGAVIAGWGTMELADGNRARGPVALCEIELLDERYRVQAMVSDIFDPLIGEELMEGCRLTVDYKTGEVQLKRK